jgi:hypothetical protein
MFLFTRTHTYYFPLSKDELKKRLVGKHVKIHKMDFEVLDKERKLSIVPLEEQVETIKTLPITSVVFTEEGNKTKVVLKSKMRQIDSGGPFLILIFCSFMLIASLILLKLGTESVVAYTLLGISLFIFTVFCIRMQMGYFDYVRKVRAYVKSKEEPAYTGVDVPFAQA